MVHDPSLVDTLKYAVCTRFDAKSNSERWVRQMVHNPSFVDTLTCAVCTRFEAKSNSERWVRQMVHNPSFVDTLTCAVCTRFEANIQRRMTGSWARDWERGYCVPVIFLVCIVNITTLLFQYTKILRPTKYDE